MSSKNKSIFIYCNVKRKQSYIETGKTQNSGKVSKTNFLYLTGLFLVHPRVGSGKSLPGGHLCIGEHSTALTKL